MGVVPVGATCRYQISKAPGNTPATRHIKMHARLLTFARVLSRGNDGGGTVGVRVVRDVAVTDVIVVMQA